MYEQPQFIQKEIAILIKDINFLRNAPRVTPVQLTEVKELLRQAAQVLQDSLKTD